MSPRIVRVAIYARLSVKTDESVSIERQIESAKSYAAARGWTVVLVSQDDGVSATKNRPEDRRGWRAIRDSPERFEAVIVWKVDRLARKVLDFLHADEALQKRGAALVAVEDPIDMTTAQGRAFATLLAVFGEMEAAAISARVMAARRKLIRDGRRVGGRPPFGYMNVPNPDGPGLVLAKDPDTIPYVIEAAARAARGESLYSIARWFEAEGVKPRERKGRKKAHLWNDASVETILRAPSLAGMTPYSPGRKPGTKKDAADHVRRDVLRDESGLPVVDESVAVMEPAEWRAMLATLDAAKRPGSRPRPGEVALLYGLARCDYCDQLLHRGANHYTTKDGTRKTTTFYRCDNRLCAAKVSIGRPALEEFVSSAALGLMGRLPLIVVEEKARDESASLVEIEAALSDTYARLNEADDSDDEDLLMERIRTLKAARREARTAEAEETNAVQIETGQTFAEAWETTTETADRREVLLHALREVRVLAAASRARGPKFDPDRVRIIDRAGRNLLTSEPEDLEAFAADLLAGQTSE